MEDVGGGRFLGLGFLCAAAGARLPGRQRAPARPATGAAARVRGMRLEFRALGDFDQQFGGDREIHRR